MQYAIKVALAALMVVGISELSKRSTLMGSALASLPLISLLGMIWLYLDTGDSAQVAELASHIFWLVLPSLLLFLTLPFLLKSMSFWSALALASSITIAGYFLMIFLLKQTGIQ